MTNENLFIRKDSILKQSKLTIRLLVIFSAITILFGILFYFSNGLTGARSLLDCMYYSLTTLSTLGDGSMTPRGIGRVLVGLEVLLGLGIIGYGISQISGLKQEFLIEYSIESKIISSLNELIERLRSAKEQIADRRRMVDNKIPLDEMEFMLFLGNPFYPSLEILRSKYPPAELVVLESRPL